MSLLASENHRYLHADPSFHAWLEHRPPEIPDAAQIALTIAQAGTALSLDQLSKVVCISTETLESMLRALVAARQVVVPEGRWGVEV